MRPILFLSRPKAPSQRFAAQARDRLGDTVVPHIAPVMEITPRALGPAPDQEVSLIFTSENAVLAAADQWGLTGRQAYCVGPRTAHVARAHGADVRLGPGDGAGLVEHILETSAQGPFLHLRGAHLRVDIAQKLGKRGFSAQTRVAYDQVTRTLSNAERAPLSGPAKVLLPCFSPRSAELLSRECQDATADIALFFLSPAVEAAWTGPRPTHSSIAASPQASALLSKIATFLCAPDP